MFLGLTALLYGMTPNDPLPTDAQVHILRTVRSALQVARHVAEDYERRAGVSDRTTKDMTAQQRTERNEKKSTAAVVSLHVFASYLVWGMHDLVKGNAHLGSVPVDIPELEIRKIVPALNCSTFYLAQAIKLHAEGGDDRAAAIVYRYARLLQDEVTQRKGALKHTQHFTDVQYKLEGSSFSVAGFNITDVRVESVEFKRVQFSEVVGNVRGKHHAKRQAERMACYNFEARKNVFVELGGFTPYALWYAKPGTGKSTTAASYATYAAELCARLDIPFQFLTWAEGAVDSFQGASARNAIGWWEQYHRPDVVTLGLFDDAETHFENRTHRGVSEGVRGIIGVTLRRTEGATAIVRGNAAALWVTNLPEEMDPAILSRMRARVVLDGPVTVEDYLDYRHLWLKQYDDQEGFVDLAHPTWHQYGKAQQQLASLNDSGELYEVPKHERMKHIFDAVVRDCSPDSAEFFARLDHAVAQEYGLWSARDIRNVQDAVAARIMDFDLEPEWLENPDLLVKKSYEEQRGMILELRNRNMGGIAFSTMLRQEYAQYLDVFADIADKQYEREVQEEMRRQRVYNDAMKRLGLK
jgi:hypothetical protein